MTRTPRSSVPSLDVLGIAGDCAHSSSAALLRNGEVVYAEAEERFSRIKGDGAFPEAAIAEALRYRSDAPLVVAVAGNPTTAPEAGVHDSREFHAAAYATAARLGATIEHVEHHTAHAQSALWLAPSGPAAVLTADGQGDALTMTFSLRSTTGLSRRWSNPIAAGSLGFFFAAITELLGYRRLQDEGKVTALAASGAPDTALQRLLEQIVWVDHGSGHGLQVCVNPDWIAPYVRGLPLFTPALAHRLAGAPAPDIAYAAQRRLEDVVVEVLKTLEVPAGPLALAGGLFANVGLNYRIGERLATVSHVAVASAMGDDGLSVGAALDVVHHRGFPVPRPGSMALGRRAERLRPEQVAVEFSGYAVLEAPAHAVRAAVVDLLVEGVPVARCGGRGEFGPRALGHRSLLYRPDDSSSRVWLNAHLGRDSVMPFAPCVRTEALAAVSTAAPARFRLADMTVAVPAVPAFAQACPGVVHRDGTVRVQAVDQAVYPDLWHVLAQYEARTGLPALMNTSLNRHGEPIVSTAEEALRCVANSQLPVLWIGDAQLVVTEHLRSRVAALLGSL